MTAEHADVTDRRSGYVAMGWAEWAKSRAHRVQGPRVPGHFFLNNCPVTVKIRTSGYQTLECFIAALTT